MFPKTSKDQYMLIENITHDILWLKEKGKRQSTDTSIVQQICFSLAARENDLP